jgi:hypothetical protein
MSWRKLRMNPNARPKACASSSKVTNCCAWLRCIHPAVIGTSASMANGIGKPGFPTVLNVTCEWNYGRASHSLRIGIRRPIRLSAPGAGKGGVTAGNVACCSLRVVAVGHTSGTRVPLGQRHHYCAESSLVERIVILLRTHQPMSSRCMESKFRISSCSKDTAARSLFLMSLPDARSTTI